MTGAAADAAYTRACNCFVSQLQPFAEGMSEVVPPAMLAHHTTQLLLGGPCAGPGEENLA